VKGTFTEGVWLIWRAVKRGHFELAYRLLKAEIRNHLWYKWVRFRSFLYPGLADIIIRNEVNSELDNIHMLLSQRESRDG
jgi:hypothetical protein